ncbi:hypothetical protein GCM10011399_03420 [Subtercola lobariae]|uniref:Uncharacterized protein n=1 Tax=Subtercola lobariae TaxID=1588641 RepID=A0A917B187_9MICO|nr:hypothetical protein GCM10011399_03420 [Subtercola lobariae]
MISVGVAAVATVAAAAEGRGWNGVRTAPRTAARAIITTIVVARMFSKATPKQNPHYLLGDPCAIP